MLVWPASHPPPPLPHYTQFYRESFSAFSQQRLSLDTDTSRLRKFIYFSLKNTFFFLQCLNFIFFVILTFGEI